MLCLSRGQMRTFIAHYAGACRDGGFFWREAFNTALESRGPLQPPKTLIKEVIRVYLNYLEGKWLTVILYSDTIPAPGKPKNMSCKECMVCLRMQRQIE